MAVAPKRMSLRGASVAVLYAFTLFGTDGVLFMGQNHRCTDLLRDLSVPKAVTGPQSSEDARFFVFWKVVFFCDCLGKPAGQNHRFTDFFEIRPAAPDAA